MIFILLCLILTAAVFTLGLFTKPPLRIREAMRMGMGAAFLFTGIDHFVSMEERYVLMIPPYLAEWSWELVALSGALEFAGGAALLIPRSAWMRLRLPDLRPVAGVGLAMLLSVIVVANGHMAAEGTQVAGLSGGAGYLAVRPFLQPFILLWALYASEAIFPRKRVEKPTPSGKALPARRTEPV